MVNGPRVVSLVPSVTETLIAWGVRPVAVTRFCEVPGYPTVGGTKNPDVPAIVALAPDLVVMDEEENRREDAEALGAAGVSVHATRVRSLADVGPTLRALAVAIGSEPAGSPEPPEPPQPQAPPPGAGGDGRPERSIRAWVPIWRRPWMSIGGETYGSSILAAAGFTNICAGAGSSYPMVTLEEAAALGPDVVLAPSEPYKFAERHRAELATVAPVWFVDGQDVFWWGARSTAALSRLATRAARVAGAPPGRGPGPAPGR